MNQDETTTEQRPKRIVVKKRGFDPGPVRATGSRIHQSQSQEQPKKKQKKQLRISDVVAIKSPPPPAPPPPHVEQERKQKHVRQLRLSDVGFHSPLSRPPKEETKDDHKTPFSKFLGKNPDAPNVVLQGRTRFKQTPQEKTKRSNDCQNTVNEFLEQGSKKIFPNRDWNCDKRKQVIQPYVLNWFGDGSK
jgi:hypothetical protein